jgi:glycosyl-4,4'-diaponeurosporenoate acyltransferase
MLIQLPVIWLVVANVLGWLIIHLGVAWLVTQFPDRIFSPDDWLYRSRTWESGGRFYEKMCRIRAWKDLLPDGAALFSKGFKKRHISSGNRAYLELFVRETCRGEFAHWIVLACSLLFFLWNPWWAGLVMVAYALAVNVPCIMAQRYNRIRLSRVAARRSS